MTNRKLDVSRHRELITKTIAEEIHRQVVCAEYAGVFLLYQEGVLHLNWITQKIIESLARQPETLESVDLYDSDTGESLITEHVVRIPNTSVKLLYTRAKRGPIVQIVDGYLAVHYFYHEIADSGKMMTDAASRFGLKANYLRCMINANCPYQRKELTTIDSSIE